MGDWAKRFRIFRTVPGSCRLGFRRLRTVSGSCRLSFREFGTVSGSCRFGFRRFGTVSGSCRLRFRGFLYSPARCRWIKEDSPSPFRPSKSHFCESSVPLSCPPVPPADLPRRVVHERAPKREVEAETSDQCREVGKMRRLLATKRRSDEATVSAGRAFYCHQVIQLVLCHSG